MALIYSKTTTAHPPLPSYGVGLQFYTNTVSAVSVYSNHVTGKAFVPVTTAASVQRVIEIPAASFPLSLDLATSGAGGLDTGAIAQNKGYGVRLITNAAGGAPALLATLNGGTPTIPAAYAGGTQSDLIWFLSASADWAGGTTYDDIHPFANVAPGHCVYQAGGGGYVGEGIMLLENGAQHTESTAVDMAHVVPAPVADTAQEARGLAYLAGYAVSTDASTAANCDVLWSADGRTTADGDTEDALELIHRFADLRGSAGYAANQWAKFEFPLVTAKTVMTATATGTISTILQYRYASAVTGRALDLWCTGWKL